MTGREAMAIGTAGYTAMLAVMALERHGIKPERGPIVVTGAAGGVGSVAVALLSKLGFNVIAATGRLQEEPYLRGLGAAEVLDRKELSAPGKPLAKERWAGAIDSVGATTLANVLAGTRYGGAVAACGLAGGMDVPTTVAPFILRAVSLLGIELGDVPAGGAAGGVEALGFRPRSRQIADDDQRNSASGGAGRGSGNPGRPHSWPNRGQNPVNAVQDLATISGHSGSVGHG